MLYSKGPLLDLTVAVDLEPTLVRDLRHSVRRARLCSVRVNMMINV